MLKTGLRKISVSYSRIAMADIATKLQLPSATAAEHVCAKAVRDGVIEATIDHANGWLLSNDVVDLYSTEVRAPPGSASMSMYTCIHVYMCMCMHVYMCT